VALLFWAAAASKTFNSYGDIQNVTVRPVGCVLTAAFTKFAIGKRDL
jgi:hypothetical protein